MAGWVVLLRGVNVGGHRKLPMAELRAHLSQAGFADPQSYIQSGNLVVQSAQDRGVVRDQVRAVIEQNFGFLADVLVLSAKELNLALAANPFTASDLNPSRIHLFFHMNSGDVTSIDDLKAADDPARSESGALAHYLSTPDGMSVSELAKLVSARLAKSATARNLRTCLKLADMVAQS